jgi:HSP20 family protein
MARFLTPLTGGSLLGRDPFLDFRRQMDRLFDESFRGLGEPERGTFMLSPKVDVCQKPDGWEITAELPGVDEKDIDLRLDGDMLTISGEKRDEKKDDKNRFVERSYGTFTRSVQLPFAPDPDKVTADCDRGVLTIKVPKGAEQERSKKIAIGGQQGTSAERTIEAQATSQSREPAVGKDWSKSSSEEEKAEKGQGAPA